MRIVTADASRVTPREFFAAVMGITPERRAEEAKIKALMAEPTPEAKAEAILRAMQLHIGKPIKHPLLKRERVEWDISEDGMEGRFAA